MTPKTSSYIKSICLFLLVVAGITFVSVLLKNFLLHCEISTNVAKVVVLLVVFIGYYYAYKWLSRKMKNIEKR